MMTAVSQAIPANTGGPSRVALANTNALAGWHGALRAFAVSIVKPSLVATLEIEHGITHTTINDLSMFGYQVQKPILVEIEYCADDEFIANWPAGGIAVTSDSATDALQTLKVEIVELYQIFKNEQLLGPEPQRKLSLLEKHLGEG